MRRAGSRWIAESKSSSVKSRLTDFEFSTVQAYIFELGNQGVRFYRNQAQITVATNDATITNGSFPTDIAGWTDKSTGTGAISWSNALKIMLIATDASGNIGIAEQSVTTSQTSVEHILRFKVIANSPGNFTGFNPVNFLRLRIGSTSGANDFLGASDIGAEFDAHVGFHSIAFTPTSSPFFIQFENPTFQASGTRTVGLDNVSLLNNEPLELPTPWVESQLPLVNGPQSADVKYFFHPLVPTYKMERRGHTTWSLVQVAWTDGPYLPVNSTLTTMTPAAASGLSVTVTASSVVGVNDGAGFLAGDIGRSIRIDNHISGVDWGWGIIVSITSTTAVKVDVIRAFPATTADVNWALGAWSITTGFPSVATFFQGRLYCANTTEQSQTVWGSQTDDFQNFTPDSDPTTGLFDGTVEADDAITATLSADKVNPIVWIKATRNVLSLGTAGGEWVAESADAVLTPLDIAINRQTTHGSAQVEPVNVDDVTLFLQKSKRKIREFAFFFESDGYKAFDMNRLARHISFGGIEAIDYASEPDSLVWTVRADGVMPTMTFRREEDVVGWARQIVGGRFAGGFSVATLSDISFTAPDTIASGGSKFTGYKAGDVLLIDASSSNDFGDIGLLTIDTVTDAAITTIEQTVVTESGSGLTVSIKAMTDAVVESVAVIPGANGAGQIQDSTSRSEVWVQVKRTINGLTKRNIEVFERNYEDGHDQEDIYYSDSLITYDGVAVTVITGLDHLEGEVVKIWADGAIHKDKTVSSGQITLDTASKVVQIGLPYKHKLKTLRIEGGNPAGTSIGKTKRIYGMTFVLLNSHTINYGPDENNLVKEDFRVVSDPMDAGAPLFTGELTVKFKSGWSTDSRVVIQSDDPVPFTLIALAPEIGINPLI